MSEQIKRIIEMEASFDRARAAIESLEIALGSYSNAAEDLRCLECYLNSDERRLDIQADESGELPGDLCRGVLSEDGIWNLLEKHDELIRRLEDLSQNNVTSE